MSDVPSFTVEVRGRPLPWDGLGTMYAICADGARVPVKGYVGGELGEGCVRLEFVPVDPENPALIFAAMLVSTTFLSDIETVNWPWIRERAGYCGEYV